MDFKDEKNTFRFEVNSDVMVHIFRRTAPILVQNLMIHRESEAIFMLGT